jgi:predicted ATPase
LSDTDAPSVRDICRKLDGIPLAIELAAARVSAFRIRDLSARLDDSLRLLAHARRASLPRHQTISTALDWSYQLLSKGEQAVFRRLCVFAGGFTLEAASAVAGSAVGGPPDVADGMASLVTKSLVAADLSGGEVRFSLLEISRAYALNKLLEAGEADAINRRHAVYFREFLEAVLRACLDGLRATQYELLYTPFLSALAEVVATAGHVEDGLAAAHEAVQRVERNDVCWWMPEPLRIKGEILLLSKKAEASLAEDLFRRSLEMANRQGALSWELRTALSLGRLHRMRGRTRGAYDLVNSVYSRFSEGFDTADLQSAKRFLEE